MYDLISLRSILPPAKRTVQALQNVFWLKALGLNFTNTHKGIFSLSSASMKTASEDPFQNCSHLCHQYYLRWESTWETRGARLQSRVWSNPDSSCPDFFSHVTNNGEADPGSNSCRRPHPTGRGNTKRAHGLPLWVISLPPRAYKHNKTHEGLLNVNTWWQTDVNARRASTRLRIRLKVIIRGRAENNINTCTWRDKQRIRASEPYGLAPHVATDANVCTVCVCVCDNRETHGAVLVC